MYVTHSPRFTTNKTNISYNFNAQRLPFLLPVFALVLFITGFVQNDSRKGFISFSSIFKCVCDTNIRIKIGRWRWIPNSRIRSLLLRIIFRLFEMMDVKYCEWRILLCALNFDISPIIGVRSDEEAHIT